MEILLHQVCLILMERQDTENRINWHIHTNQMRDEIEMCLWYLVLW